MAWGTDKGCIYKLQEGAEEILVQIQAANCIGEKRLAQIQAVGGRAEVILLHM